MRWYVAAAPIMGPHRQVTSPEYQINNRWIEAKFLGIALTKELRQRIKSTIV